MRLELEVFGDVQMSRELLKYADRGEDLSPAFEALAEDFYDLEQRQFASEGALASGGWAPLAPSTIARKGPSKPILEDTGALRDSLTGRGGGNIRRITSDEMFLGTSVPYAAFHQRGTRRMPRRRPVELRGADRVRWVKMLQRHIETGDVGGPLSGLLAAL